MLLKRPDLDAIVAGSVDLVFRRWKRPTVKAGGTLRTACGVLSIEALDEISETHITKQDVARAGYASRDQLLGQLVGREGQLYRIRIRWLGNDPRIALRSDGVLTPEDVEQIRARLERFDKASRQGPWTVLTLDLIRRYPETLASDLASKAGWKKPWFKTNVRKLKNLGLTESLGVGYRLSPRGKAFVEAV